MCSSTNLRVHLKSYEGEEGEDGVPEGVGLGVFATTQVEFEGRWRAGRPAGNGVFRYPNGLFIKLCVARPTAHDFEERPNLVSPGYAWPQRTAGESPERRLTLGSVHDLGGERTYTCTQRDDRRLQFVACDAARGRLPASAAAGKVWLPDGFCVAELGVCDGRVKQGWGEITLVEGVVYSGHVHGTSFCPVQMQGEVSNATARAWVLPSHTACAWYRRV